MYDSSKARSNMIELWNNIDGIHNWSPIAKQILNKLEQVRTESDRDYMEMNELTRAFENTHLSRHATRDARNPSSSSRHVPFTEEQDDELMDEEDEMYY